MGKQRTLSPRFILLSQRLVQATHRTGTRCNPHEGGGDLSDGYRVLVPLTNIWVSASATSGAFRW